MSMKVFFSELVPIHTSSTTNITAHEPAPLPETGFYELVAVLTHQGRSADGGHYIAWVKESNDKWLKFDDDKVHPHGSIGVLVCCRSSRKLCRWLVGTGQASPSFLTLGK